MKAIRFLVLLVLTLVFGLALSGCDTLFGGDSTSRLSVNAGGAFVPPSLTGGAGYSGGVSGSAISAQQTSPNTEPTFVGFTPGLRDEWIRQYGLQQWWMVPSVSVGFNNEIILFRRSLRDLAADEVRSISQPPFTRQTTISANDIARFDEQGDNWESFRNFDGQNYTTYTRFHRNDGYERQLKVHNLGSGDNRLIMELYRTENFTYLKSLSWNNTVTEDVPPQLRHFIAVIDNRAPEMRTTARMMMENRTDNNAEIHTMAHSRGSRAGHDYGLVTDITEHWPGRNEEIPGVSLSDFFSLFNLSEFNILLPENYDPNSTDEVPHTWPFAESNGDRLTFATAYEAFIHPDDIGFLFEQGFTEADWPILIEAIKDGSEGIEFKDWDFSGAAWLN